MKTSDNTIEVTLVVPTYVLEFYMKHCTSYTDGMCKALESHVARVGPDRYRTKKA